MKPKPLEQLRAEKERAETQLAQDYHNLHLSHAEDPCFTNSYRSLGIFLVSKKRDTE